MHLCTLNSRISKILHTHYYTIHYTIPMLTDASYIAFDNFLGKFLYHIRRYIVVFPKYLYLCVNF